MKTLSCLLCFFCFISAGFSEDLEKPYVVYLRPGSVLTRLSDKKDFQLEKGILVRVSATNYKKRDRFTVYNEAGNALYETSALNIAEVENDLRILPTHQADVIYPAPDKFQIKDKIFALNTFFNVHMDNLQTEDFNSIYSDNLSSVTATRFEFRTLYSREAFPVQFGGSFNYQSTSWRNDFDQVRLSIFSFGPVFQYGFYHDENMKVSVVLGAEFSPVYRTSSGESKETYKAMLFDLGVESVWKTQYGNWLLGSHFRKHDISLEKTTRPLVNPTIGKMTIISLGLMVGYKHEWDL